MRKNKGNKKNSAAPQSAHGIFQIFGLCVIIYVIFQAYTSDDLSVSDQIADGMISSVNQAYTKEAIQAEIDKAMKDVYESPKFIRLREFVGVVDAQVGKRKASIIEAGSGYLLFVPGELVKGDNSKLRIKGYGKDFNIESSNYEVVIDEVVKAKPSVESVSVDDKVGEESSDLPNSVKEDAVQEVEDVVDDAKE